MKTFCAWSEKMYQNYLNDNDILKDGKPIMHGYRTSHGGDLNENDNFKVWKLIIHGYKKLHGGDLNENEH